MATGRHGHPGLPVTLTVSTSVVEHVTIPVQPMAGDTVSEVTLTRQTVPTADAEVSGKQLNRSIRTYIVNKAYGGVQW